MHYTRKSNQHLSKPIQILVMQSICFKFFRYCTYNTSQFHRKKNQIKPPPLPNYTIFIIYLKLLYIYLYLLIYNYVMFSCCCCDPII